jgi:hypothetical protein
MKRTYNCDFNFPGEFLPPVPQMNIPDRALLAFKQRLDEIVHRRDTAMAKTINKVLKEALPNDRFFFAVGYSKKKILVFYHQIVFSLVHAMNAEGIIGILRRDYQYSVTRLCTDPQELRFVVIMK